jgi:UDP-N-acetylglucosamine 4,6-dehydratase
MRQFDDPMADFDGASLLVTGATGSFGKHFVRTVLDRFKPRRLVIYSRDEMKQYEMAQQLEDRTYPMLRYFIGDVRDAQRLEMAMSGIDYVVHAAALKQVPIAEYNPFECIHTNVLGAENVVRASIRAGVKKVITLSTDKATSPINLYGASKLASDKIFIAANHLSGAKGPRFAVVRYGNVMGSRGSVIPLFQRLVREGCAFLPVTHADMTRFWITLSQGVNFVLSSFAMMQGGEVFVPKLPSMRILDLAHALSPTTPIKIIGIRAGEKLHEIMITEDDARTCMELPDRYVLLPAFAAWMERRQAPKLGAAVSDRFSYASNNNSEWVSAKDLHGLMQAAGLA